MSFDTKKFINEIQNRPSIWNTKCPEYCDRNLKQKAWEELVNIYGINLPNKAKKQLCLNLQKKWRNIRDCFVKTHKAKNSKSASAAKKKAPYVFYDNLLFLKNTVYLNTKTSNVTNVKNNDVNKATENVDTILSNSSNEPRRSIKYENEEPDGRKLTGVLNINSNFERNNFADDEDRLFFLSLVKEFNKIPEKLRIQTKLDILKVIKDAQFLDYRNTTWNYSRPKTYRGYQKAHHSRSSPYSQPMNSSGNRRETVESPVQVQSPLSTDSQNSQDSEES